MCRDQNKSECIRRNKQKNPITEVRISSSKTLTRMITVNLFQPEIFSKADSEMWYLYYVLSTVKLFQREILSRIDIRSSNITRGNHTSALPIRSRLHYSGYHSATHSRMTCADCHSEPAVAALCPVSDVTALLCWYPLQASDWVLSS